MTGKQIMQDIMADLPDDCTLDQIRYELYARDHIERGLADVEGGRGMSHEEVGKRLREILAQWQPSAGRSQS